MIKYGLSTLSDSYWSIIFLITIITKLSRDYLSLAQLSKYRFRDVIKAKKQATSDAEVSIKKLEHDVQALAKEKASHVTAATNLERQYEWIVEESK